MTEISLQNMPSVNCGNVIEIHWIKCWNTDIVKSVAIVENQESMENITSGCIAVVTVLQENVLVYYESKVQEFDSFSLWQVLIHAVFGSRLELPWWIQTTSWWSCWAVLSSIISSAQQTAERDTTERTLTRSACLQTTFCPHFFSLYLNSLCLHSFLLPVTCFSLGLSGCGSAE